MSTASSSPEPIITCCSVVPPEKITRKASDAAENLQLLTIPKVANEIFGIMWFWCRSGSRSGFGILIPLWY